MTPTWTISKLDCMLSENGLTNVVYAVHWRYKMSHTIDSQTYEAVTYSATPIGAPDPASFTTYENLTKEQVVGWVTDAMEAAQSGSVAAMATRMEAEINAKITPVSTSLIPPFQN